MFKVFDLKSRIEEIRRVNKDHVEDLEVQVMNCIKVDLIQTSKDVVNVILHVVAIVLMQVIQENHKD